MIKSLVLLCSLLFSTAVYAGNCTLATEKDFFALAQQRETVVLTLSQEDQLKFMSKLKGTNVQVSDTAKVYFGVLGAGKVGIVIMQDGCVVEGTLETMPAEMLGPILAGAGIDVNNLVEYDLGTTT